MKKLIALLLALTMLCALCACAKQPAAEETKQEEPKQVEPKQKEPKQEEPKQEEKKEEEPKQEEVKELTELGKIAVLNNAVEDLEFSTDAEARFNAYWLKGFAVSEYVENNFLFKPEDLTLVSMISYEDGYTFEADYVDFAQQVISMEIPEDLAANYEMIVCGEGSQKDYFPYHVGYIVVGPEAMLFMKEDGYKVPEVFEAIGMADAEEYDFVCADGYTETIMKEDLEKVELFYTDAGTIDSSSVAYPEYTLMNIQYIAVADLTADTQVEEGKVAKLNIFANGAGVMGEEAAAEGYFGGNLYNCYKVSDLLAACEIPESETVTSISYKDGASAEQPYAEFIQKYISLDTGKDRQPWTLGKVQARNDYIANAGYYVLGNNAIAYVPDACVQGSGLKLTDILATMGMEAAAECQIVCADGYAEVVEAEDFAQVELFHIDGRVDSSSVAYPTYTLMNVMYIIPMG